MSDHILALPPWAEQMRATFRSGSANQFVLYGNVVDLQPAADAESRRFLGLKDYLTQVMFAPFDLVLCYDRGRGIRVKKGGVHFYRFLEAFDTFQGTNYSRMPKGTEVDDALDFTNLLPRDSKRALELIDRFLRGSVHHVRTDDDGKRVRSPLRVAVIIDYAHFVVPAGEALHMGGDRSQILIQLLDWSSNPSLTSAPIATVLITENLTSLNRMLIENPYTAKIRIDLPDAPALASFIEAETADHENFDEICEVPKEGLSGKLVGLSRINVRSLLRRALDGGNKLTAEFLSDLKKELIEKEAMGLIDFVESSRSLDDVAGHAEAKAWLRQDAALLAKGRLRAIPMGYLLCGRIGTGKTWLVSCWAGEVGIPVVQIKNFRDRWVGATEANLERIFQILDALGQVIVFVDEADQATGKRGGGDGDGGLGGRIYGMLAEKMSDTTKRGKIIWIFATSRPDMLEVDLKRQGRLDVHIPLFPPGDPESRHDLFYALARKVGVDISKKDLPELPLESRIGGNEMEGLLVRTLRLFETRPDGDERGMPAIVREVIADMRPSAHVDRLRHMDLLAVKECTDARFLPERFATLETSVINAEIARLEMLVG